MKISSEAVDIAALKGFEFDLTDAREAYRYDEVVKRVGEYCGRVYGPDIKVLVVSGIELTLEEPSYPSGDNVSEKDKAVWNKKYDRYLKKIESYDEYKAKSYEVVWGRCTKAMRNRIKKLATFEDIESSHDVIKLLQMIKQQIFDANERKYSSLRMVQAWRKLITCKQNEDEDLIDYYCWNPISHGNWCC